MVVVKAAAEHTAKVPFVQYDHVVQAVSPDGTDQSLDIGIGLQCQMRRIGTIRREVSGLSIRFTPP